MFIHAQDLWKSGKYDEAIQNFIALTKAFPDHELVDDALFLIGSIYEHFLHEPKQAIRFYRTLNKNFENSEYNQPALSGLARSFASQNDDGKRKAINIYQKLQVQAQKDGLWEKDQINLAELFFDFKQFEKARIELKRIITERPDSDILPKVYHLIGFSYYLEGQPHLAVITFKETDKKFNYSKVSISSAISLADIYEELGQLKPAIQVYKSIQDRLDKDEIFYQLASDRITKLRKRQRKTNTG